MSVLAYVFQRLGAAFQCTVGGQRRTTTSITAASGARASGRCHCGRGRPLESTGDVGRMVEERKRRRGNHVPLVRSMIGIDRLP